MEAESAAGEQEGTVEWSESDSPLVIIWPLQIISIWHSGVYKDQIKKQKHTILSLTDLLCQGQFTTVSIQYFSFKWVYCYPRVRNN